MQARCYLVQTVTQLYLCNDLEHDLAMLYIGLTRMVAVHAHASCLAPVDPQPFFDSHLIPDIILGAGHQCCRPLSWLSSCACVLVVAQLTQKVFPLSNQKAVGDYQMAGRSSAMHTFFLPGLAGVYKSLTKAAPALLYSCLRLLSAEDRTNGTESSWGPPAGPFKSERQYKSMSHIGPVVQQWLDWPKTRAVFSLKAKSSSDYP